MILMMLFCFSLHAQKTSWRSLGPFTMPVEAGGGNATGIGRINCITFDPGYGRKNAVIYAGAPTGGLFKSTNNGLSWKKVETDLPLEGVSEIAFDKRKKKVIYLATGDRDGIPDKFRPDGITEYSQSQGIAISRNGGKSWSEDRGNWNNDSTFWKYPSHKNITSLVTTKDAVYCSMYHLNFKISGFDSYIFRSADQGRNWELCMMADSSMIREMIAIPGFEQVLIAVGERAYISHLKGAPGTWSTIDLGNKKYSRIELACSSRKPGLVYLFASIINTGDVDLFTCNEKGEINLLKTYNHLYSGDPRFRYVLEASNTSDDLYFGNLTVFKIDSSRAIQMVSNWYGLPTNPSHVHADVHDIQAAPDSNVIYVAHDGGISRTYNNGGPWQDISEGLDMAKFYRISCSQLSRNVMTGTQDVGTMLYVDSIRKDNKWRCIRGGDGGDCLISYASDSVLVHSDGQNNVLAASIDAGRTWKSITPRGERGDFLKPLKQDPNEPNTIYVGYHDVYKSRNLGKTWNKISDFSSVHKDKKLGTFEIAASDTNVMYAGYDGPTWDPDPSARKDILFVTKDGGNSWEDITGTLLGVGYTILEALAIDDHHPETVFAGFGQAWDYKVMRSDDAGKTWINYSEGLSMKDGVNTLMTYNRKIYAGTHLGVYSREIDGGTTWEKISDGLPQVPVYDLDIHRGLHLLRAATNGRGLWECTIEP